MLLTLICDRKNFPFDEILKLFHHEKGSFDVSIR